MTLLHLARRWARRLGLEVHRFDVRQSAAARQCSMLEQHGVDLVIDVGANDGGYASELRGAGWRGTIVSFEPLADAHARLVQRAQRDASWLVAPCAALGAQAGAQRLFVAANSASSSLLTMLDAHRAAAPESATVGEQEVTVQRLDDVPLPALQQARRPFLKIDAQGSERAVLQGATHVLARCVGVRLELSLLPLYEDQALWRELVDLLDEQGLEVWDLVPGFIDPRSGRLLQIDALFFRRGGA